jgi:hypothetical protein
VDAKCVLPLLAQNARSGVGVLPLSRTERRVSRQSNRAQNQALCTLVGFGLETES